MSARLFTGLYGCAGDGEALMSLSRRLGWRGLYAEGAALPGLHVLLSAEVPGTCGGAAGSETSKPFIDRGCEAGSGIAVGEEGSEADEEEEEDEEEDEEEEATAAVDEEEEAAEEGAITSLAWLVEPDAAAAVEDAGEISVAAS